LGQAGDGYLYNGSSAALGRVAPYRLLDRDARGLSASGVFLGKELKKVGHRDQIKPNPLNTLLSGGRRRIIFSLKRHRGFRNIGRKRRGIFGVNLSTEEKTMFKAKAARVAAFVLIAAGAAVFI
jgi:hypothetical protein